MKEQIEALNDLTLDHIDRLAAQSDYLRAELDAYRPRYTGDELDNLPKPGVKVLWWHCRLKEWHGGFLIINQRGTYFYDKGRYWDIEHPRELLKNSHTADGPTWWMPLPPSPEDGR